MELNATHDPARRSWVQSANLPAADFPIQNLPLSVFRRQGCNDAFRGGVAIGDQIVDLAAALATGCFEGESRRAALACSGVVLNDFLAMGPPAWRALRHSLSDLLRSDAGQEAERLRACLVPQADAIHAVPTAIGDYTDFYTSIDHATNVGRMVRPQKPLTPNFQWMPIGYHGRSSSICISGTPVRRPNGQRSAGGAEPTFGPCQRLDYEMELGVYVGTGNPQGVPVRVANADQHLFGICLLNDWSARDIQLWETAPLGPFQGKNFATTVSPWIVTMEALVPYRKPWARKDGEPQPLPYLDAPAIRERGAIDIQVEVWLRTAATALQDEPAARMSHTSFAHQYWTVAQMLAHHTVGGCNLSAGDLFGTGTISGPTASEAGCLMELTSGGSRPVPVPNGEQRTFLEDGDTVVLKAYCERDGFARIGFGECAGSVQPALQAW